MKVVSIDVGIRNLGIGVFETLLDGTFVIHYWDVIDVMSSDTRCSHPMKRGKRKGMSCDKPSRYQVRDACYCSAHYPLKKSVCSGTTKKGDPCKSKVTHVSDNLSYPSCKRHATGDDTVEVGHKTAVKQLCMNDIAVSTVRCLDRHRDTLFPVDRVLIEQQPSIATHKVKCMADILYTYFIVRGIVDDCLIADAKVLQISAKKKMLSIDPDAAELYVKSKRGKKGYATRKKASIDNCDALLAKWAAADHGQLCDYAAYRDTFAQSNKKDDLADAFLQAYWYMKMKST